MRGNVRETKQNSLIPLEDVGVQESACVSAACEHYKRRVCSQHTHAFFDLKMRQIALVCLGPHSIPAANLVETRFSTSRPSLRAGLQHVFDQLSIFFVENLVANLLQQSRRVEHVSTCRTYGEPAASGSLVRTRARQMECRKKTSFEPANEPV